MDHRPANLRPPLREILLHHNRIDRPADATDRIAQANRLGDAVLDVALDDQEVQVAVACEFAPCCRPEQDHPGRRPSSVREALSCPSWSPRRGGLRWEQAQELREAIQGVDDLGACVAKGALVAVGCVADGPHTGGDGSHDS